jgi:hypothetical protein
MNPGSRVRLVGALLLGGLCAALPSRAVALDPIDHQLITTDGCGAAGLPEAFCRRAGVAAHDVDANEWSDLTAHAQSVWPDDLCGSANAVVAHVNDVGQEFFDQLALAEQALADPTASAAESASVRLATALGRALHALQDNCAHQGVSNPEHAWITRSNMCGGATDLDDDPVAVDCARGATEHLLAQVAPVIVDAGVVDMIGQMSCVGDWTDPCDGGANANLGNVCDFLGTAVQWDGVDRRWDKGLVSPQLETAFMYGTADDLCGVVPLEATPAPTVDVSAGPPVCTDYHVTCLGDGSSPNGWACFGCAGARPRDGAAGGAALLALASLVILGRRRR